MCANQNSAAVKSSAIELINIDTCISCHSGKIKKKLTFLSKDDHWYTAMRCKNCGLIFASPQPVLTPESINEIYSSEYYANYFGSSIDYQDKARMEYYMQCYEKEYTIYSSFVKKMGDRTVLDVGCGDGRFLEIFKNHGWLCLGLEPSEVSRSKAREKGFKILETPFLDVNENIGKFDLIFIDNVIEHINNPIQFLKKAFALLNEDGVLVLKTPNSDSLIERSETTMLNILPSWASNFTMNVLKNIFNKGSGRVHRYGNLHPPVHLAIYNNDSIKHALVNAGFSKSKIHNYFISPHHPTWGIDIKSKNLSVIFKKHLNKISNKINKGEFLISISIKNEH